MYCSAKPSLFYHIVLNDVVNIFFSLSNKIKRLLYAVVLSESCLLSSDKKYWNIAWSWRDGFAEQYICASAMYLMSVMSQFYSIIIDWGISATKHGKEVVYGLNYVDKRYIYQFMSTFQLPGSKIFDSNRQMHTGNKKYDVSLAKEFQHHLKK